MYVLCMISLITLFFRLLLMSVSLQLLLVIENGDEPVRKTPKTPKHFIQNYSGMLTNTIPITLTLTPNPNPNP